LLYALFHAVLLFLKTLNNETDESFPASVSSNPYPIEVFLSRYVSAFHPLQPSLFHDFPSDQNRVSALKQKHCSRSKIFQWNGIPILRGIDARLALFINFGLPADFKSTVWLHPYSLHLNAAFP
jgi:hypothetical protein